MNTICEINNCDNFRHVFIHHKPWSGKVYKVGSLGRLAQERPKTFHNQCVRELEKEAGPVRFKPHWGRACNSSLPLKMWKMDAKGYAI